MVSERVSAADFNVLTNAQLRVKINLYDQANWNESDFAESVDKCLFGLPNSPGPIIQERTSCTRDQVEDDAFNMFLCFSVKPRSPRSIR